MIHFDANPFTIGKTTVLRLPLESSKQLPSRGMVMVKGTMNGKAFMAPLEPDGKGSHWMKIDEALQKSAKLKMGETVKTELEATKDWPEPSVPADVQKALRADNAAKPVWDDITPMARWDWLRWINATKNPATRQRRIEVTLSKLGSSKRRPCCFNRSECTDPEVSKNGVLLETA